LPKREANPRRQASPEKTVTPKPVADSNKLSAKEVSKKHDAPKVQKDTKKAVEEKKPKEDHK